MHICSYRLSFHSPAFLGNASQGAQWRTPPIKALLRQWWRVAYAAHHSFQVDVAAMRHEEGVLLGHAWLEDDFVLDPNGKRQNTAARQSRVRIRLSHWDRGQLKDWPRHGTVRHPEVPAPVGSDLYLGFGPLEYNRASRGTALKNGAAIQAGASTTLSLAFPETDAPSLLHALWLMDRYGTLGGRSRNGWGSLSLQAADAQTAALEGAPVTRNWQQALQLDWPHALGSDAHGPLAWQTRSCANWPELMHELTRVKVGLRTQFKFTTGRDAPRTEDRHWLAYPVTNHSVGAWGNNARLPNSLRFKVRPAPGDPQRVVGVVFHMPCLPPPAFSPQVDAIAAVWKKVHAFLDAPAQQLTRIPA